MTALAPIANHLWQSTLIAALLALVTLAFRRNRAAVRHALWLAASIKFLVPFAALATLGAKFAPALIVPGAQPVIAAVIGTASQPFAGSTIVLPPLLYVAPAVAPAPWSVVPFVWTIWAGGSFLILAAWWIQWRRIASMARRGRRITAGPEVDALRQLERRAGIARPVTIVESPGSFEPGVFGIRTPVLLWPASIGAHLTADQLFTILAHEVAHVRRRDNLAAALQTLISAIFWFHPLVWWIGARLADERERACDEEVLHAGGEPELYAETILTACRLYVQAPPTCVSGVASSNLRKRIERIMANSGVRRLTLRGKLLLAVISFAVIATPVAVGALTASPLRPRLQFMRVRVLRAPDASAHAPSRVEFEVTSVRRNASGPGPTAIRTEPGGTFHAQNVTLRTLIQVAYRLQPAQLVGGPDWLNSERFDVAAKSDDNELAPAAHVFPIDNDPQPDRLHQMLQAMLADRFKLVVHEETREMPIYALIVARSDGRLGPALKPSTADCRAILGDGPSAAKAPTDLNAVPPCGIRIGPGSLMAGASPVSQLANTLSGLLDRTVVDRTNLTGRFDASLQWTPEAATPSIFTAIQEQLGLELDATNGPVDRLVIVSAQPPTAN